MEQYIMKGGNPLVGEVTISGAKNAALGILAAAIMTDDDVVIDNLPDVSDINALLDAISHLGAKVDRIDRHTVRINAANIHAVTVEDEHMRKIRASYYFIGALLGKYKSAEVPLPGGCTIGSRPIDQHLKGFRALGSDVKIVRGAVVAHAIDLVASHIYLDVVSVGATINIMMAATMAEGETILENVAKEPHVVDVANFFKTLPYPGFPTDMQPQMTVALALADGTSVVTESIFENRFKYVDELSRMGANIKVEGSVAIVDGVTNFTGAQVVAPDLRAGAALVLAGLAADGYTTVDEIGYVERGYENFEEKLRSLGAVIERVDSEKEAQKFRLRVG